MQVSIEDYEFYVEYIAPSMFSALSATNNKNGGYVQVVNNLVFVDGEISKTPKYITMPNDRFSESKKLNLTSFGIDKYKGTYLFWDKGFEIGKNFTFRTRFIPSDVNKTIIKFYNKNGDCIYINLIREIPYGETDPKDYFILTAVDRRDNIVVLKKSNYIELNGGNDFENIWIRKNGNTFECILEKEDSTETIFEWGDSDNNVTYNIMSDITYKDESYYSGTEITEVSSNIDSFFPLNGVWISNGVYDFLDFTRDITTAYNIEEFPTWDANTIINCDFNDNISAGNVDSLISELQEIRLKRKVEDGQWVTIKVFRDIVDISSIDISYIDNNIPSELHPTKSASIIEGNMVTTEVDTCFDGCFISDGKGGTIFKLYNSVMYDTNTRNIRLGLLQPIGSQYPTIVKNSKVNYASMGVSATLCGYNFETTRKIDREDVIKQANDLQDFLTNGEPKILYDWNGNIYLMKISSSPTLSYSTTYTNGIVNISFNFVEQGKYDNEQDLIRNGLM